MIILKIKTKDAAISWLTNVAKMRQLKLKSMYRLRMSNATGLRAAKGFLYLGWQM